LHADLHRHRDEPRRSWMTSPVATGRGRREDRAMTDNRFVYMFLYAQDLSTTRRFYEDVLGFRVLEEDSAAVKYDAGEIILALNRARDHGVDASQEPIRDELMVFHVSDIDAMRAALEARGVT